MRTMDMVTCKVKKKIIKTLSMLIFFSSGMAQAQVDSNEKLMKYLSHKINITVARQFEIPPGGKDIYFMNGQIVAEPSPQTAYCKLSVNPERYEENRTVIFRPFHSLYIKNVNQSRSPIYTIPLRHVYLKAFYCAPPIKIDTSGMQKRQLYKEFTLDDFQRILGLYFQVRYRGFEELSPLIFDSEN